MKTGLLVSVVVLVTGFASGSAPVSMVRGVQPRQSFDPRVFGAVVIVGGLGAWLIARYGTGFAHTVAGAVGLGRYPNTVAGVLFALVFTALFALSQALMRRTGR